MTTADFRSSEGEEKEIEHTGAGIGREKEKKLTDEIETGSAITLDTIQVSEDNEEKLFDNKTEQKLEETKKLDEGLL